MPLLPGAQPYYHAGGPVGALLCHGFTGTPQSLRPWAERLAAAGLTVSVPRLPGHGTSWQEMARTRWEDWYAEVDRAYEELRGLDDVFVMGLSLGGCMALRLAQQRPDVAGLVLVNPSLTVDDRRLLLQPVLRFFMRSLPGLGDDIKRDGVHELAYDRVPLSALSGLRRLWSTTRARLGEIRQPVLVFVSGQDHVVGPGSVAALREGLAGRPAEARAETQGQPLPYEERRCTDSYHVATLDNDADMIFEGSLDFVRAHSSSLPERG